MNRAAGGNQYAIDSLLDKAAALIESGRQPALCVLVRTKGSTPAQAGAMLLIDDNAAMFGTIGGGCVEAEVRQRVLTTMLRERHSGLLHFDLNHDYGWDDGLICGGQIDVAVVMPIDAQELRRIAADHRNRKAVRWQFSVVGENGQPIPFTLNLPAEPRLYIAGAGHVGQALVKIVQDLGFHVMLFDDRSDLLIPIANEFPAINCITGPIDQRLMQEPVDVDTSIVIVTRGHRHDEQVLEAVVNSVAGYIGMIGSKRKVALTMRHLRERGVSEDALKRVCAPIGVEINSITVQEIALSIAAQLVRHRRADYQSPVSTASPEAFGQSQAPDPCISVAPEAGKNAVGLPSCHS